MNHRIRYGLVTLGIIIFLLAVPLIAMFITGERYDFSQKRFVKTGILVAVTSPGGASVSLNGKPSGKSSETIRFLTPGDYDISISKAGYFDWTKRLSVQPLFITYTTQNNDYVYLLRSNPQIVPMSTGVLASSFGANHIAYVTSTTLYIANNSQPTKPQSQTLTQTLTSPKIIASANENYYIVADKTYYAIYNIKTNTLLDISTLLAGADPKNIALSNEGIIYFIANNSLYSLDLTQTPPTPIVVSPSVQTFVLGQNSIYYITSQVASDGTKTNELIHYDTNSNSQNAIDTTVPNFNLEQLYITKQNQLFLIGDQTLYSVGTSLSHIADYVQGISFDETLGKTLYYTNNEIDLYDNFTTDTTFVTRSSTQITSAYASLATGWVFFINDGRLQSIELDNRDHQNNYTFAQVEKNASFSIDPNANDIFLLNNGTLEELLIR